MVEKMVKPELVWVKVMCGEFGEVTVIIGLVINFLAFVSPLLTLRDTLTYIEAFSTSQTCQMWRNFRFLHICHAYKFEISPHDKFFSTYLICDICDKYQVCCNTGQNARHTHKILIM